MWAQSTANASVRSVSAAATISAGVRTISSKRFPKTPGCGTEHLSLKKFGRAGTSGAHLAFPCAGFSQQERSMNGKTLLLASVFLGGSVLAAAAQSGTGTPGMGSGSGSISAATHCLDQATGQPRLKTASSGSGSGSMGGTSGSASSGMSGSGSGTKPDGSASTSGGSTTGSGGMPGSSAANLPSC
jgi:hypothetical protein